jgi:hypothetical protein
MCLEAKYKSQIQEVLKKHFFESWMDDDDWSDFEKELFLETNTSYLQMSEQIDEGIKNGHSLEYQIELIVNLLG